MTAQNVTDASLFDRTKAKIKDKLSNVAANLGTNRDKQSYTTWTQDRIGKEVLEALYSSDWAAGKIVDIPVQDMLRNWRCFPTLESEESKRLSDAEKKLGVKPKLSEAMKTGRLYGGSIVIMGVEGTGELDEPLDIERVKQDSLKFLHIVDRHDCSTHSINTWDASQENYRQPEYYSVNGGQRVHWTRTLRFDGVKLPFRMAKRNNYWGESILNRVHEALQNSQSVAQAIASLLHKADVDVVKIPNFMHLASTPDGEKQIIERFALASLLMSNQNMLILDSQEDYQTKSSNLAGLKDFIGQFLEVLSAACDIPQTRLLGQSTGGLSDTGEGDLENYYDKIEGERVDDLEPQLCRLDEVMVRSALGSMPDDYEYEFNPLWQMSAKEEAEIGKLRAETAQIYKDMGAIDEMIVAKQLNENNTYIGVDDDYIDDLEAAMELNEKLAEEMALQEGAGEDPEAGDEGGQAGGEGEPEGGPARNEGEEESGDA